MSRTTPERLRFVAGLAFGLALPLLFAELVARFQPPQDLRLYRDDDTTGIYRPDPVLRLDYHSFAGFEKENAMALQRLGALDDPRATWLFFGNSFVQAEGMLGATAQAALPEKRIFYLGRNEILPLRVAQARLLVAHGLRPERIIFTLLPNDFLGLGVQPLETMRVSPRGALKYRLRLPPEPLASIVRGSRLTELAWVRSGRHVLHPEFRGHHLTERAPPSIVHDVGVLLGEMKRVAQQGNAQLTVLLIPNREQIFGTGGFALQDAILDVCREQGIDCLDARDFLVAESNPRAFFLPDWHFDQKGNERLLARLLAHFEKEGTAP